MEPNQAVKKANQIEEVFKRRVAKEFRRAVTTAQERNISVEAFAQKLGVTRSAVYKIMDGNTVPTLGVLRKAKQFFGVQVSYGELGDGYVKTRRGDPRQIKIEFSVGDISRDQIEVKKFSPAGENSLELLIRIDFSKTA